MFFFSEGGGESEIVQLPKSLGQINSRSRIVGKGRESYYCLQLFQDFNLFWADESP